MRTLLVWLLLIGTAHAGDASLQLVPTPEKKPTRFEKRMTTVTCGDTKEVLDYVVENIPGIRPVFMGTTDVGSKPVQLFREAETGEWFFFFQEGDTTCSVGGGGESTIIVTKPYTNL